MVGSVITPRGLPEEIDQTPVPGNGSAAPSVTLVAQSDWSGPASTKGEVLCKTMTSSVEEQMALEIVQVNVFVPKARLVAVVVGAVESAIRMPGSVEVQTPVPTVGVFAVKVTIIPHSVWSGPALATVTVLFVISTSSKSEQPF